MSRAVLTKPADGVPQELYLETSDILLPDESIGEKKIALCKYELQYECPTEDLYEKFGGKCLLKGQQKMNYPDALYYCQSRGAGLPIIKNELEKRKLHDFVSANPIWLEVTASKNGWSDNNDYSWHASCPANNIQSPNERQSFCDAEFAEVYNKEAYTTVSEQSDSMDVVCTRESSSEFYTPPELPRPATTTTTKPETCPPGKHGVWSEWVTIESCPTTCGSCNRAKRKRVCNKLCGCECIGEPEDIGPCGIALCAFPIRTCCFDYVKSLNYQTLRFFCGKSNVKKEPEDIECSAVAEKPVEEPKPDCPPGNNGRWSDWTTVEYCPTTCGSCHKAKRRRVCNTTCGCECKGDAEDIGPCGVALCPFPTPTCCFDYVKSLNYQTSNFFCGMENYPRYPPNCAPIDEPQPRPRPQPQATASGWSEWKEWAGKCDLDPSAYDSRFGPNSRGPCGFCGKQTRKRTCLGPPCNGEASQTESCGSRQLCSFPTPTCCKPYIKSVDQENRNFICA